MDNKNKPSKDIRVGNTSVAIWENHAPNGGTWLTASLGKRYQDKDGKWKTANNYNKRELEQLSQAIHQALAHLEVQQHQEEVERHRAEQSA